MATAGRVPNPNPQTLKPILDLNPKAQIAQKPYIVWSLGPKGLKESLEPKGMGVRKRMFRFVGSGLGFWYYRVSLAFFCLALGTLTFWVSI